MSISQAVFAAGCFWGIQAVFDTVPGVVSTTVGYTGGQTENPDYRQVCTGGTGHAEAVKVVFDDKMVTYDQLLDIFFANHDPTTLNRQGPDVGTQYRSAVFWFTPEQKKEALAKIEELNNSGTYPAPVVTEVAPAAEFYPAEEYHQKYLAKQGKGCCGRKTPPLNLSEEEWKKRLSPEQYKILREKGTEKPFSGQYLNMKDDGTFVCGACGNPVFRSGDKFDSGSGWPSFDRAIPGSIRQNADFSHGMVRVEVTCARCGSHLGHVFEDGPTNTGMRYCCLLYTSDAADD
mgnify:FL=1